MCASSWRSRVDELSRSRQNQSRPAGQLALSADAVMNRPERTTVCGNPATIPPFIPSRHDQLAAELAASLLRRASYLHPIVVLSNIEQTTASASTRRKPRRNWPWATVAVVSLCALVVVLAMPH